MRRLMSVAALAFVVGCSGTSLLIVAGCSGPAPSQPAATPSSPPASPAAAPPQSVPSSSAPAVPPPAATAAPTFGEVTVPAGTPIAVVLTTAVASDASRVEDRVEATIAKPVMVKGVEAIPAEATAIGFVTDAQPSGHVKGRARVAIRFTRLTAADRSYDLVTAPIVREARVTKGSDAKKIGIGAGAGAAIGAIMGGKKGAAIGAGVGGGAGTGVVMATRGEEVRLAPGTRVTIRLRQPLTLKVKQ